MTRVDPDWFRLSELAAGCWPRSYSAISSPQRPELGTGEQSAKAWRLPLADSTANRRKTRFVPLGISLKSPNLIQR